MVLLILLRGGEEIVVHENDLSLRLLNWYIVVDKSRYKDLMIDMFSKVIKLTDLHLTYVLYNYHDIY